ncbi:hypothetical protein FHX42_004896 [Saccharopolyspora lacisalsi]|uniref:Uncharacterized protein n=1 Tax=Halosaccharopolyspora lacisalsi TaxID=1000566 RepID=A0A839E378_9PSEU|nr:hypothetical protein [Halosaccharopolyspora lacisalsi]MBA8827500.1 hypothetical protein [Halosaccharopolyspora lacisalsi]
MRFRMKAYRRKRQLDELDTVVRLAAPSGWVTWVVVVLGCVAVGIWLLTGGAGW